MHASRKRSRAGAAACVAAGHGLLIYFLMSFGITHPRSDGLVVPAIQVSLIEQPRKPPFPEPSRLSRPKLAALQLALMQPIPEFRVFTPSVLPPSAGPITHAAGSPARRGKIGDAGGPVVLTITHYVAPIYPAEAARFGEHGSVVLALRVNASWGVGRIELLRSAGSAVLDRAAARAAQQWQFAPVKGVAPGKQIWVKVKIEFAPPQRLLGVPIIIMPYAAVVQDVGHIGRNRGQHLPVPPARDSVRRLLHKVLTAFPRVSSGARAARAQASSDSLEKELASLGPLRSVTFLGFIRHGSGNQRLAQSFLP